jgi:hypothetical protein
VVENAILFSLQQSDEDGEGNSELLLIRAIIEHDQLQNGHALQRLSLVTRRRSSLHLGNVGRRHHPMKDSCFHS